MHSVFVGIGSNIDRENNINSGLTTLTESFGELLLSSVYESIPYGFDGNNFYNLVVKFSTKLSVQDVIKRLREIEVEFGRAKKIQQYSPRTLDIDLLLYGDLVSDDPVVRVPREDLLKYSFVLCPMAELAPDLIHPVEQKNYERLWQEYDKSRNDLWKVDFEWDYK